MFAADEPDEVYKALVADLAYSIIPTTIMGLTIGLIGGYIYELSRQHHIVALASIGVIASVAKLILLYRHSAFNASADQPMQSARRFEAAHALLTSGVAGSVASISASAFAQQDLRLHLVATALLFAYAAGVVCRLSVRPRIASAALIICSVPALFSIFLNAGASHIIVATLFLILAAAGLETIAHVYRNARKHITVRLQMAALARRDPLTKLSNRLALQEAFDALPRQNADHVALHAFDLDGFKEINDRYGHHIGDQLLSAVATRLQTLLPIRDFAARVGGDEFVFVQTAVVHLNDIERRARDAHSVLTEPYSVQGKKLTIGLSLGYSSLPASHANLQTLMEAADEASYKAKRSGGGVWAKGLRGRDPDRTTRSHTEFAWSDANRMTGGQLT